MNDNAKHIPFRIWARQYAPDAVLDFMANRAENAFNRALLGSQIEGIKPFHTALAMQKQLGELVGLLLEVDEAVKTNNEERLEQLLTLITANSAALAAQAMLLDYSVSYTED
jgi:hypothetical protein